MKTRNLQLKRVALFVLLLTLIGMTNAFAQEFTADNLKYSIIDNGNNVSVIGHIDGKNAKGNLIIPDEVSWKRRKYPVTKIQKLAFYECSGLTSTSIPNSVTSIGRNAFQDCIGLTSVTLSNSLTSIDTSAFRGCNRLTSISIPNSVTSIEAAAFYGCSELTSISIPNSVTSIGDIAFQGCSGLTSISIPNSVISIGFYAFADCTGLTSITLPNSLTSIGSGAFLKCSGLTSISIPNSVTDLGDGAFVKCTGLTSISIPNSVTSISDYAFQRCTGLTSITLPNSITSIGKYAFHGCTGLISISIPNSVTSIGDFAFKDCTGLTSVTIDASTKVGKDAFKGCDNLKLPQSNTVTSITQKLGNCGGDRKLYDGEFKMKGFDYDGEKSVNAKATYEYYNAPDDTRVFDGFFCFGTPGLLDWTAFEHNQDMLAENITIEDLKKLYYEFKDRTLYFARGKFSQNKQVGKWIWISKFSHSDSIYVCIINFNEDGIPEGDFEVYHFYRDSEPYKDTKYYKPSYISGTIVDGVIVSIDYKSGNNARISGRYNKDGYPIGQWSFSGSDYTDYGKYIQVAFDDEGNCIKNYRTDPTTGDKIALSGVMKAKPIRVAKTAINYISHRFFRSTNVRRWPQDFIEKYEYYPY